MLAAVCIFAPDSPRWLLSKGRRGDALKALERLDIERVEAEKDILSLQHPPAESQHGAQGFLQIFEKQYRGRTMLGLFVLGILQLSGIDGVLYVRTASVLKKR